MEEQSVSEREARVSEREEQWKKRWEGVRVVIAALTSATMFFTVGYGIGSDPDAESPHEAPSASPAVDAAVLACRTACGTSGMLSWVQSRLLLARTSGSSDEDVDIAITCECNPPPETSRVARARRMDAVETEVERFQQARRDLSRWPPEPELRIVEPPLP